MTRQPTAAEIQHFPLDLQALAPGWSQVWLEEIADEIAPGFASGAHNGQGEGVPHLRPMNVGRDGKIDMSVVKSVQSRDDLHLRAGDVLFNNTNSPELIGKTALISAGQVGFAYSNHMTRVRLSRLIHAPYISYWLHFLWRARYLQARCVNHVNQASISLRTLATSIPLVLPPAPEQHRIVDKIDELLGSLDAGVAELKAAQKNFVRYRQSLNEAAVTGFLGRTNCKAWKWLTVGELSKGNLSNGRSVRDSKVGAKVLRLTALKGSRVALSEFKYGDWSQEEASKFAVVDGDLLIARGNGSLKLVGRGASVSDVSEAIAFPDTMIRVRVDQSLVRVAWLSLAWNSSQIRRHIESRARTSAGIYKISQPDISSACIPVPPLYEQDSVLDAFDSAVDQLNGAERACLADLKRAEAQRQNILKAAFSGQLVPQDPNDEPASVLLDRIRAERAARPSTKPSRGRKPEATA